MTNSIRIADIALALGLTAEDVTLPNGKVVKSIVWRPEHLPAVFAHVNTMRAAAGWGRNDSVIIDGVGPTWLIPAISHALHPAYAALAYPQGGPGASLPVSGITEAGAGGAPGVSFKIHETDQRTTVEVVLESPAIDAVKAMAELVAPWVPTGIPVCITGRGPTAIAVALAEAYAHKVPYVCLFQPGTGYVVGISHSPTTLGTVFSS